MSELVNKFLPKPQSDLYEKYKDKGVQVKIRENDKDNIFIDFYFDTQYTYLIDPYQFKYDGNDKESVNDKDKDKATEKDKDKNDDDIIKTIIQKIKLSKIFNKSEFSFYFKMFLRTDFLFKFFFEEDIEKIIENIINFKIIINSDINTKIFLLSIIDILIEKAIKRENSNMKDLFSLIKGLISIPIKNIKYDLIENNKKEIYNFIKYLLNEIKFEQYIQKWKNLYNSKDFIEELCKDCKDNIEILDLIYKIIDVNELCFTFGFSNNKLGLQIKTHLLEDNKIHFLFL